jgi:DNA-binding NarL/FixJ family response regulator
VADIIKVAIADDHALFRAGVRTALGAKRDIEMIAEADNGMQLLNLLRHIEPHVILLDIQMPVMDGIVTLPEIRKLYPQIKVIILSMHNDHSMISKLMEVGANSYLTKNSASETIYQAIRTVYEQEFCFNELTNKALLSGLRLKNEESHDITKMQLTDKEIHVLRLLCNDHTTKGIANQLDISPRTVEAMRDKLKQKTGAKSTAGLVMYATKTGIIDNEYREIDDVPVKNQTRKKSPAKKKIYMFSQLQMVQMFDLSTSVLNYVNHDLRGQAHAIGRALQAVNELLEVKGPEAEKAAFNARQLLSKAIQTTSALHSITDIISKYYTRSTKDQEKVIDRLFISRPAEILKFIKSRYPDIRIDLSRGVVRKLEIVYPPRVLLAILTELIENAQKVKGDGLRIFLKWKMEANKFVCEVHDNGPGWQGVKASSAISYATLSSREEGTATGMGLRIIDKTMTDSKGHLIISTSPFLKGAKILFAFPVIDYTIKTTGTNGKA